MYSDALSRAYRLMGTKSGSLFLIRALAVLQALLVLLLAIVMGLVLNLADHKGVTHLESTHLEPGPFAELPAWLRDRLPPLDQLDAIDSGDKKLALTVPETGLYPVVANTALSSDPVHRVTAGILDGLLRRFRPLRENQGALISLMIIGLVVLLLIGLVARLRHRLAVGASLQAANGLRNHLHRQMYRFGQTALPREGVGPAINLFTRDVNEVRDGLLADLLHGGLAPVLAVGLMGMALVISPPLAIFLLALGGLLWLAAVPLNQSFRLQGEAAAQESALGILKLQEDLSMLRTVRVFGMDATDRARFTDHLNQFHEAEGQRLLTRSETHPGFFLAAGAAVLLAVGLLCRAVLLGQVEMASILLLIGLMGALIWPVSLWLHRTRVLKVAEQAARSIMNFMERKPDLQMKAEARFLPPLKHEISLQRVSVQDHSGHTLLHDLTAQIPAGSRVSLLSLDEDAKHAVACLIPRLLDPTVGSILIDSIDLRDVTLESLRAQISLILQADYVFSDTVFNNIGLGDPTFTSQRVIDVAKTAHAHNFIQRLPNGYDTEIGPLGHPLTLDQQFRIALARATLHDPSIMIIEEPAMAMEASTSQLLDDTYDRISKGRTLVFLPHRHSTIRKSDLVLVLHHGTLNCLGHPRDLQTESKLFRHIQYLEFNQFATSDAESGSLSQC